MTSGKDLKDAHHRLQQRDVSQLSAVWSGVYFQKAYSIAQEKTDAMQGTACTHQENDLLLKY